MKNDGSDIRGRGGPTETHDPHYFMQAAGNLFPGSSALFRHLDWNETTSSYDLTDIYEYVFDAGHENCVLNGERAPIRYNFERQRLETVGSRGLVRNVILDDDIENNQDGYAYILDKSGLPVSSALVRVKNVYAKELKKNDRIATRYHFGGASGQPNYWIQLIAEISGVQKRWYMTGAAGIPKAFSRTQPRMELCERYFFNGSEIVPFRFPPQYDEVWNASDHGAIPANDLFGAALYDDHWFADTVFCRDNQEPQAP